MRNLLTIVLVLLVLGSAGVSRAAADPLEPLRQAEYITGHDVQASLPHGDFTIISGVIASLPGIERRWGGMLIGDVRLDINRLPQGPGVLNLFGETEGHGGSKEFRVTQAYLVGSFFSGITIEPSGYATEIRSWDQLTEAEREQFTAIYLQSYSDGFVVEPDEAGGGGHWAGGGGAAAAPEVELRDPRGDEVFAAIWDEDGQRFDYRVNEDGSEVTIKDYYRGVMMYQYPWAPEEGEEDENLSLTQVNVTYFMGPDDIGGEKGDSVSIRVDAIFQVLEDADSVNLISAPWLDWKMARLRSDAEGMTEYSDAAIKRGGEGTSPWMLTLGEQLTAGTIYSLELTGEFTIPRVFSAIGYGGVYRFDTTPLWPGENNPVHVNIAVSLPGVDWHTLISGDGSRSEQKNTTEQDGLNFQRTLVQAIWENNTRNQMIAVTKFPMRELDSDWGALEVYAPAELIDTVHETEYVSAVGDMMEYYTSLWGDWRGAGANTDRQVVFLLPDETGVQAFEDAGFVFILGGSRTGIPLVAHEVAHLWWGQGFSAPRWFQEGMANYGAAKFLEAYRTERGIEDPLFYRRYIMNFSLGHELPLSLQRRDELDDSAAVYHNSAGFLLTADNRVAGGLDPLLRRLYEEHLWQPNIEHDELGAMFAAADATLGPLWDTYVERGVIEVAAADDETYRELTHTPQRDQYVLMLNWLTPSYMKSAIGDYDGAIFCAEQALTYRSEPKDYFFIADLMFKAGRIDEATERATALLEREDLDPATAVKANFLFAQIYRSRGDAVNERAALEYVIAHGPAANSMFEVREAQLRLAELTVVPAGEGQN